jgi:hypothetical protein
MDPTTSHIIKWNPAQSVLLSFPEKQQHLLEAPNGISIVCHVFQTNVLNKEKDILKTKLLRLSWHAYDLSKSTHNQQFEEHALSLTEYFVRNITAIY